ncbi:acyl-[acyl-carrier-protein] thioesterase [Oceanobacillus salinisoli]|uniref:acyl-[acyl-carrier-protein] thioesterase n=1 Tax=Oceanobacillus salinisoli TaxID=2678611 RepID=UPI001E602341|nr:acyl-ACP thioesterase domain-containing protein [Oceanobacillus salinisoli]
MEASALYKKKYHIDLRDVDFTKKLKLSTLFSYFQDIASLASENLGVGIDTLEKKHGVAWVLMRIRVDIERLPRWDEEVTIETWPLEPGKLEFDRDYIVRDGNEKRILSAVSSWVIMDLKERKLKRTKSLPFTFPAPIEERAIDGKLDKIKHSGPLEIVYSKVIGYSDVDFNGHLNNSKYVDYIMDCFPLEDHKKFATKSIEVNFIHEALPGDTIILQKDTSSLGMNKVYVEGVNEKDSNPVFKAQVEVGER